VQVQGWAKEGVIASYRLAPGGSPVVWDPVTDKVTTVWGGKDAGPTFVAYTLHGGPRWILYDGADGCWVTIKHPGETAPRRCSQSVEAPAAFSDDGQVLAAANSAEGEIRLLDRKLTDTGPSYPVPGLLPQQIVPTPERLLVVVADVSDGSSHVLGCGGQGPCQRDVDGGPGETIVLATP
jgi:hypothetical protein